jgi:hypothetical protein
MATWGTVTLTNNPADQVLAFVAYHLSLGPDRIHLYFDDPVDPAAKVIAGIDRVDITLCDADFWSWFGKVRPEKHQERQRRILRRAYRSTKLDWLLHIDIDEFLLTRSRIATVLDDTPKDQPVVQARPFEALYQPGLPDDIFTARQFRAQINDPGLSDLIFGPLGPMLTAGMLSHKRGKPFFRTGIAKLIPEIHHAEIGDYSSLVVPFHPDLALLHFHADNPETWVKAAHRRAVRGAYRYRKELSAHLISLETEGLYDFHRKVHQMTPEQIALLRQAGILVEADLHLRDRVAVLTAGRT